MSSEFMASVARARADIERYLMPRDHSDHRGAGMNDDAIREAAIEALSAIPGTSATFPRSTAATVIDAVRPLIEAQLRERLAAAIEARATHDPDTCTHECDSPYCFGCADCSEAIANRHAARLVRERP